MAFSSVALTGNTASEVLPKLFKSFLRILLFVLLYFDSRAWFTKSNFVEIPGGQEAFLAALVVFFLVMVFPKVVLKLRFEATGIFILSVIAFVMLVSAGGAWLIYRQPLYAGMIEERRVLSLLIFFPVAYAIRSNLVTARTVLNYVTGASVLCVLNALVYYMKVSSLEVVENFASEADARADRTPIGTGFVLMSLCYVLSRYVETPKLRWAALWLVFVFYVIVLEQGRQTIMAVGVASVFLLILNGKAFRRLGLTLGLCFAAMLPFIWSTLSRMWEKYVFLFTLLSNAQNLRVDTIHTVMSKNLLIPHGALWAQWNGGFSNVFGPSFFLSDIGVFGELFCYGAVLLGVLLIVYYGYILHLIMEVEWTTLTRACTAFMIILMMLHMFQPVIEHGGFDVGVILAILSTTPHRARNKRRFAVPLAVAGPESTGRWGV